MAREPAQNESPAIREVIVKKYIFLSSEGYTYQPGSESVEPDIENLQVVGFAEGYDADTAFNNLLLSHPAIKDTTFRELFSYRLDDRYEHSLSCHLLTADS